MKTVEQEQDLVAGRRELLASKSVSELSKVTIDLVILVYTNKQMLVGVDSLAWYNGLQGNG